MKTFEILKLRRENGYLVATYNVDGDKKDTIVSYWELVKYREFKVERDDLINMEDTDLIENHIEPFLHELEKVDLIEERNRLRAENEALASRLIKTHIEIMANEVRKDYFKGIENLVLEGVKEMNDKDAIKTLKHQFSDACYRAVIYLSDAQEWLRTEVLQTPIVNEKRRSA